MKTEYAANQALSLEPTKAPITLAGHPTLGRGYNLSSRLATAAVSMRRHREMKRDFIDGTIEVIGALVIGLLIASPMYLAGLLQWWHA